jgi:hypothetical protein
MYLGANLWPDPGWSVRKSVPPTVRVLGVRDLTARRRVVGREWAVTGLAVAVERVLMKIPDSRAAAKRSPKSDDDRVFVHAVLLNDSGRCDQRRGMAQRNRHWGGIPPVPRNQAPSRILRRRESPRRHSWRAVPRPNRPLGMDQRQHRPRTGPGGLVC